MILADTIEKMVSPDYKERFEAEYDQLIIRYLALKKMLEKWDNDELDFEPTCPREIYDTQTEAMVKYITVLTQRAALEGVHLEEKEE